MLSSDELTKWILSLPPNADVFEALERAITHAVANARVAGPMQWVLVGMHGLIAILALAGIAVKYFKCTGWLVTRDQGSGLWRPCASIVPQLLFAVYAVFFLITVPTCLLKDEPSPAAYIFNTLSYIPIGLAMHATVISTFVLSLSTSSPLAMNSATSPSKRRFLTPLFGLWTALLFILCHVPVVTAIAIVRRRQQSALREVLMGIDAAAHSGLGLAGLVGMEPLYERLTTSSAKLFTLYRVEIGVYGVWAVIWMLIYIPSTVRLVATLRIRRRRLTRGIRSLRVVDDLVTQDDLEAAEIDLAEKGEGQGSSFSFARTPHLSAPGSLPVTVGSPTSPDLAAFPSGLSSPKRDATIRTPTSPMSGSTLRDPKRDSNPVHVGPRTGGRGAELQGDLAKANRTLATILVQFLVSFTMVGAFLPFACLVVSGDSSIMLSGEYQTWIGWTFAGPALVSSSILLLFSLLGPTAPAPSPLPPAPSTTSPLPLFTDFTPTSPTSPPQPTYLTPDSPAAHPLPRSPTSSRRLARALRAFFEWPTERGSLGEGSNPSSLASSSSSTTSSASRPGTATTMQISLPPPPPAAVAPKLAPPPPAASGRKRANTRASSRPATAESLVDAPLVAVRGHQMKGKGGSVGTRSELERVGQRAWVPSHAAREMREIEAREGGALEAGAEGVKVEEIGTAA